jgi:hypothetical protein
VDAGGDGSYTDIHSVSNVAITASPAVTVVSDPATAGGRTLNYGPTTASLPDELDWVSTNREVSALRTINTITVRWLDGALTVSVDGTQVLTTTAAVGPTVLLEFSGGTGAMTDDYGVSDVSITST